MAVRCACAERSAPRRAPSPEGQVPPRAASRALFVLLLLMAATGCGSFSTLDRARVLAPGQVRATLAGGAIGSVSSSGTGVDPRFELGLGYGAGDDVEVFGKVWNTGVSGGTKMQVTRTGSDNNGVDVAVAPSIGWQWADKLTFDLPLLAGVNVGGDHQVVLALRPSYVAWVDPGGLPRPVSYVFLGGSLGFWLHLTQNLAVLPEVAWTANVFAEEGFGPPTGGGAGLQLSLGVVVLR